MIVVTLLLLSDSVIAGLTLGEDAVAAISLVTPAYSLAAFFGGLLSVGVPILYSKAMGEFKKENANSYFASRKPCGQRVITPHMEARANLWSQKRRKPNTRQGVGFCQPRAIILESHLQT